MFRKYLLVIALLLPASAVQADPKVYSPQVDTGELAFELRGNTVLDNDDSLDGSHRHVLELEYGVNDWWKTALVSRLNRPGDGSFRYESTAWENIIELTNGGDYWLDAGLYLEYKLADQQGAADVFETKLLLEKAFGRFLNTLNLTFEKEVGQYREESVEFAYAWRTKWPLAKEMAVGFEAFGELGEIQRTPGLDEQEHILGPVFYHEVEVGDITLDYNVGWLVGLTDASPDNTLRWQVELEF